MNRLTAVLSLTKRMNKQDNGEFCRYGRQAVGQPLRVIRGHIPLNPLLLIIVEKYHETYIPTFRCPSQENPRLSGAHENRRRPRGHQCASCEGPRPRRRLIVAADHCGATRMPIAVIRFSKLKRLNQRGVKAVLQRGRRLKCPSFELKLLKQSAMTVPVGGRLAIAVAKHQLKKAVSRNRIKRLVRESFRQHTISANASDLLVTYRARDDAHQRQVREALRRELATLFDAAVATKPLNARETGKT